MTTRTPILHPGAGKLKYEIREIVAVADKIAASGVPITWENIGDPVAKGETVPQWIREIVANEILGSSDSFAYSPTKGLKAARDFLAQEYSRTALAPLSPDHILFFNGLGDAISKVYTWLHPTARVLGPNPAYPTHASIEAAHARSEHLTYELLPENGWLPDLDDVRNKVRYNPSIAAILIINPGNPTGCVYPRETLEALVEIAREYGLFIISDEIYAGLVYDEADFVSLADITADVPLVVMRGLSKEVPWPGSRCGWLAFFNAHASEEFQQYIDSIEQSKMSEVCSTTLPQAVLPAIMGDPRYVPHLVERRSMYQQRAKRAAEVLHESPYFAVVEPKGAFYLTITLTDAFLANPIHPAPKNPTAGAVVTEIIAGNPDMAADTRLCYELLAATGICTVPLSSGFSSHALGLRMTLLEQDDAVFEATLKAIADLR